MLHVHPWGRSYPSAEKQSVYSTAPADWAIHRVNVKTVLFQIIQFSINTQFKSKKQLSKKTTVQFYLTQSGPGKDGNNGVLHTPQSSSITGTSPSDCLVSYVGHSFGVFYSPSRLGKKSYVKSSGGFLPLCRGAVCVFYSPSRLENTQI